MSAAITITCGSKFDSEKVGTFQSEKVLFKVHSKLHSVSMDILERGRKYIRFLQHHV